MAKTKKKRGFMDGYKTYDPSKEGFGNAADWRDCFFERLGIDRAIEVLGEDDPHVILGVAVNAPWEEVQKAYRRLARKHHPDMNRGREDEAKKEFQTIQAAYEVLEQKYGK